MHQRSPLCSASMGSVSAEAKYAATLAERIGSSCAAVHRKTREIAVLGSDVPSMSDVFQHPTGAGPANARARSQNFCFCAKTLFNAALPVCCVVSYAPNAIGVCTKRGAPGSLTVFKATKGRSNSSQGKAPKSHTYRGHAAAGTCSRPPPHRARHAAATAHAAGAKHTRTHTHTHNSQYCKFHSEYSIGACSRRYMQ